MVHSEGAAAKAAADRIVNEHSTGLFISHGDFVTRTGLSDRRSFPQAGRAADAFRSLGLTRRPAYWMSLATPSTEPLLAKLPQDALPCCPGFCHMRKLFSIIKHRDCDSEAILCRLFASDLEKVGVCACFGTRDIKARSTLPRRRNRAPRQPPGTAKGITFMTLEDETGTANLIVRPAEWEKTQRMGRQAKAIIATGLLQRQDEVIHIIVSRLEDITSRLPDLGHMSRDFR